LHVDKDAQLWDNKDSKMTTQVNRVELTLSQYKLKRMLRDWESPSIEAFKYYSCQSCENYNQCFDTRKRGAVRPLFDNCRMKDERLRDALEQFFMTDELEFWCDLAGVDAQDIRNRLETIDCEACRQAMCI